jgi:hypothetical protein
VKPKSIRLAGAVVQTLTMNRNLRGSQCSSRQEAESRRAEQCCELSSSIDEGGQAEEIQSELPSLYTAETEAQP